MPDRASLEVQKSQREENRTKDGRMRRCCVVYRLRDRHLHSPQRAIVVLGLGILIETDVTKGVLEYSS